MLPRPHLLGTRKKGKASTKYQQEVIPPPKQIAKNNTYQEKHMLGQYY